MATTAATAALVRRDPATIVNGTEYYFTVKAVTAVGAGPASNQASATPEPVPGAPQDLVATAGGGSAKLTWDAPASPGGSPVTGYDLYQGTSPGGEGGIPVCVPGRLDRLHRYRADLDRALLLLRGRHQWLRHRPGFQRGLGRPYGSGRRAHGPEGHPGRPAGRPQLVQAGQRRGQPGHGVHGPAPHRVRQTRGPVATSVAATVTSYTVTGLENGGSYQFAVQAVNASGTGLATAWASAVPTVACRPTGAERLEGHGAVDHGLQQLGPGGGDLLTWSGPRPAVAAAGRAPSPVTPCTTKAPWSPWPMARPSSLWGRLSRASPRRPPRAR